MKKEKMKIQNLLGYGIVAVGVVLLTSNNSVGTLFIGFGIGYSVHPFIQKLFKKK